MNCFTSFYSVKCAKIKFLVSLKKISCFIEQLAGLSFVTTDVTALYTNINMIAHQQQSIKNSP